ncbi:MAG: hypothetical protein ABH889_01535 [Candidatus Portnoybacteria bacterium]
MFLHYAQSKKFRKNHNRGLALLSVVIFLSVLCLGFFYLIQTNSLVGQSYQIREKKEYLKGLEAENHKLEIEIARLQSPANLEGLIQSFGLVDVGKVIYLESEKAMAVIK